MQQACIENSSNTFCNYTSKQYSQNDLFSSYSEILAQSNDVCNDDPENSVPCMFFSNYCTLISTSQNDCKVFDQNYFQSESACLTYRDGYQELIQNYFLHDSFDYDSQVTIILGVYSPTGEFIRYSNFEKEINACGAKSEQNHRWRQFGYNYYQSCQINLSYLSLNFYEPFFYIEKENILVSIPVVPKNYVENGRYVNKDKDRRFVSRFFLFDNYSVKKIQYATEINIMFQINEDNEKQMHLPYMSIDYNNANNVHDLQDFSFSAVYLKNENYFGTLGITVIVVFIILGLAYFVGSFFISVRSYSVNGMNSYILFSIVGSFFYAVGISFFLISVFIGIYLVCGYKFPNHPFMTLKPTKSYFSYQIFLYIALGLTLIGTIFRILKQSNSSIFVIDWDDRSSSDNRNKNLRRVSQYRQSAAAYEWFKLSTIRRVDPIFVVIAVLFFLRGLKWDYLQQPIPSLKLIDVGKKYRVIEIGLTSFLWVAISLVFCLLKRFVYWPIFGNPFQNFREICLSMNISVVLMLNSSRGFLIHGRQLIAKKFNLANNENFDETEKFDPEKGTVSNDNDVSNDKVQDETGDSDESERSVRRYSHKTESNAKSSPTSLGKKHKIVNSNEDNTESNQVSKREEHSHSTAYSISNDDKPEITKEKEPKQKEKKTISEKYNTISNVNMKNTTFKTEVNDPPIAKETTNTSNHLLTINITKPTDQKNPKKDDEVNESDDEVIDISSSESTEAKIPTSDFDDDISIHSEKDESNEKNSDNDAKASKSDVSDDNSQPLENSSKKSTPQTISTTENIEKETEPDTDKSTAMDYNSESKKSASASEEPKEDLSKKSNSNQQSGNNLPNNTNSTSSQDIVLDKISDHSIGKSLKEFKFNPITYEKSHESVESADSVEIDQSCTSSDVGLLSSSYSTEVEETMSVKEPPPKPEPKKPTKTTRNRKESTIIQNQGKRIKKEFKPDPLPKYRPLGNFDNVHTFEIALDEVFFHFVNKNDELINYKIANGGKNTKSSIRQLMEETNDLWVSNLSEEHNPHFIIEPKTLVHTLVGLGPVAEEKSIFTIQNDISIAETMLFGIEGTLIIFYLIVFAAIESFSNASIAGLIVLLIDFAILKLFKWKRRKYLIDHDLCIYRSLVR